MTSQRVFKSLSLVPIHEPSYFTNNNINPFTQITPVATSAVSSQANSNRFQEVLTSAMPLQASVEVVQQSNNNDSITSSFDEDDFIYNSPNPKMVYPSSPSNREKERFDKKINTRKKTISEIVDSFPSTKLPSLPSSPTPDTNTASTAKSPSRIDLFDLNAQLPSSGSTTKQNHKTLFNKSATVKKQTKAAATRKKPAPKPKPKPKPKAKQELAKTTGKRKSEVTQSEQIEERVKRAKTNYNFKERLTRFRERQQAQNLEQSKQQQLLVEQPQELEKQKQQPQTIKPKRKRGRNSEVDPETSLIQQPQATKPKPKGKRKRKPKPKADTEKAHAKNKRIKLEKQVTPTGVQVPASESPEPESIVGKTLTRSSKHEQAIISSSQPRSDSNNATTTVIEQTVILSDPVSGDCQDNSIYFSDPVQYAQFTVDQNPPSSPIRSAKSVATSVTKKAQIEQPQPMTQQIPNTVEMNSKPAHESGEVTSKKKSTEIKESFKKKPPSTISVKFTKTANLEQISANKRSAQLEEDNNDILKGINEFRNYMSQQVDDVSNVVVHHKPNHPTNQPDLTVDDAEQTIIAPQSIPPKQQQHQLTKLDYTAPSSMFNMLTVMLNDVTKRMEMVDNVITNKHQQLKLELDKKFQGLHDLHKSKVQRFLNSTKHNLEGMILSEDKLFDGISNGCAN